MRELLQLSLAGTIPDVWLRCLAGRIHALGPRPLTNCFSSSPAHIARTSRVAASPAFHFRILVVANHLSDAVQRRPFEVIHDNRIDTLSRD